MSDVDVRPVVPVSLVLTVLNEEKSLGAFLESVAHQSHLPAEVVVVDGGSRDRTVEILRAWRPPGRVLVTVRVIPGANIAAGRNAAIATARHELIAVSDAGAGLSRAWLWSLYSALRDGADVASGFFRPVGDTFLGLAIATTITPRLTEIDPEKFLPSSRSLGITKDAWRLVGGYPEWLDYCEDLVFDLALRRAGLSFVFIPSAVVTWDARSALRAFATQYYRYARGDGKADLWRRRHVARYLAYLGGTVVLAGSGAHVGAVFALLVGFLVYQSRFLGRVASATAFRGWSRLGAIALAPAIVVLGDLGKMVGYPAGVLWRLRRTPRVAVS